MENVKGTGLPTVGFACPIYGNLHRKVYLSHLATVADLANHWYRYKFVANSNKTDLISAQNGIVEEALSIGVDYLFWTEMDMILPTHTLSQLLSHDKDVVSGVYFLRRTGEPCLYVPIPPTVKALTEYAHTPMTIFPRDSLFPVGCAGMGCLLTKMDIFKKMEKPWFGSDGDRCTSDMVFQKKLRDIGVQMYADSNVLCRQIDEDEPKEWGIEDYEKWLLARKTQAGFISTGVA